MAKKRFDQVTPIDPARIRAKKSAAVEPKGVNYTIPGLIALFGIVLVTALFLNDGGTIAYQASDVPARGNTGGAAVSNPLALEDSTAAGSCEVSSYCDGSKLIRQHDDCSRFVVYCQNGCVALDSGAVCR